MENKTIINDRITQIKTKFCANNNKLFAEKLNCTEQYASNICNGQKSTGKKILEKILAAFPEVNRAWLYFGEGNMLKSDNSTQHGTFGENNGIIVQHGGGGDTYNNQSNAELMQLVVSQQKTIHELTEQNKILTQIIKEKI